MQHNGFRIPKSLIAALLIVPWQSVAPATPYILAWEGFEPYVVQFNARDEEIYIQHIPNADTWAFLRGNVPLLDCPEGAVHADLSVSVVDVPGHGYTVEGTMKFHQRISLTRWNA